MSYSIQYSDVADMEIHNIVFWVMGTDPDAGVLWRDSLIAAVEALIPFPRRCPIAREAERAGIEVRALIHGRYRVLYTILDADADGQEDTVRILLWHGARRRRNE